MDNGTNREPDVRKLTSVTVIVFLIVIITVLHYTTPTALPIRHDIYYRLYYIPIILAAFTFGLAGGVISGVVISIVIFPHILIDWGGLMLRNLNMIIEVVLYNIVGLLTGFLVSSERKRRIELELAQSRLQESFKELEERGERLLQVEESLRAHEKLALLGEMAAIMAHEVRNPLGSIQGAAELLTHRSRDDEEAKKYSSILIDEVRRLNGVVTGFIDSARKNESIRERVDVSGVLRDVVYLYSRSALKKGVRVKEWYQDGLPAVLANEDMLRQVFINILLNAVEAVTGSGEVSVSASSSLTGVRVVFHDTGKGIPADIQEKIFDLFYTTREGGTGFGLAISRRIVEEHGGRIEIRSTPGEGTEVIIELPAWNGDKCSEDASDTHR